MVIEHLQYNPSEEIILTNDLDSFCISCPHKGQTTCDKDQEADQRIKKMDQVILNGLQVSSGHQESFKSLVASSQKVFSTQEKALPCCQHCEWQAKCLFFSKLPY